MPAPTGDAGTDVAAMIDGLLRDVPDFPEPGVLFKDIAPLLADPSAFGAVITAMAELARGSGQFDVLAGIEARGFVLAAAVAHELSLGVVLVRKAGKLPPPTVRAAYDLEYGTAEIEVPLGLLDGRRVYLVDDVLATGGTLRAAADLIARAGGQVSGIGMLVELGFLQGRDRLTRLPSPTALLIL